MRNHSCQKYAVNLIYFQILYNIIAKYCISQFGFSNILSYVTDIVTILILLLSVGKLERDFKSSQYFGVHVWILIMISYTIIDFIANLYNPLLYLWGLRNTYRFFIFFLCCVVNLRKKDIELIFKWLAALLPLDVILCTLQYYSLRGSGGYVGMYLGDFIGGIFGAQQGSNASTNLYLCILLSYYVSAFINKKISLTRLSIICAMSFYIAILAEMKVIYVEFILILVFVVLVKRVSIRMIGTIFAGTLLLIVILNVWTNFNPNSAALLNWDKLINYSANTGYAGAHSLNRLSAIQGIKNVFFMNDSVGSLLGVGLGNADTSSFDFLRSTIYNKYGTTLRYTFFFQSMLYLETGCIGLALYIGFFLVLIFHARRSRISKKVGLYEDTYISSSMIFALLAIFNVFYNNALRIETCGYLAFLWLAVPLIWERREEENLNLRRGLFGKAIRDKVRWANGL